MNSLSAPAASSTEVTGHFDYILDDRAFGWAFAPAHPQKKLTIEIIADGEVVAQGIAQQFREDLQTAGIGDGCYMFDLQLSHELYDGEVHDLAARVAETGNLLSGTHAFGPERREPAYPQIPRAIGLSLLADLLSQSKYSRYAGNLRNFAQAYRLAARLQETGEVAEARSAWATINSALGENSLGYCKLGESLMLLGLAAEALDAFRVAAGCDLRLHWAHLGIANSHFALGQFEQAEEAMQIAIALQPHDITLPKRLKYMQDHGLPQRVEMLLGQSQREEAIGLLKAFLLKRPDSDQACALLGDLLCEPSDNTLPGMTRLHELRKAQCVLEALLDDVETRLDEASE
ncbi:tetratricopeptide repeat protein [Pseudomonas sp. Marseille-QA0332]